MEYTILPLGPEHLAQCALIEQSAQDPWNLAQLQEELDCQQSGGAARLFVALHPQTGQVAGLAAWQLAAGEASLYTLTTHPQLRRQGVGRCLLAHCLAELTAQGAQAAFLEVRASNLAAQQLYRQLGFAEAGRRRNFYADPREDGLVMCRTLP